MKMQNTSKDWPEPRAGSPGGNSVDVLVYVKRIDQHYIAWFNFSSMQWITPEGPLKYKRFRWRNLNDKSYKY